MQFPVDKMPQERQGAGTQAQSLTTCNIIQALWMLIPEYKSP